MAGFHKCPICKGQLWTNTAGVSFCNKCSLIIDTKNRKVMTGTHTPDYILQSMSFIERLRKEKPKLCLSPYKLWDTNFKLDDVIFYSLNKPKSFRNKLNLHLIAADGVLADELYEFFIHGLCNHVDYYPVTTVRKMTANQYLFLKTVLQNVDKDYIDYTTILATKLFFQPTLEGIINSLFEFSFTSVASLEDLDNELLLYSWLMVQPHTLISWSGDSKQLLHNIYRYADLVVQNIGEYDEYEKDWVHDNVPDNFKQSPLCSELQDLYLQSMPSTAVNCQGKERSNFDILDNQFLTRVSDTDLHVSTDFTTVISVLSNFKYLYDIIVAKRCNYGIDWKRRVLLNNKISCDNLSDNEIVFQFWKLVQNKLKEVEY